MSLGNVANGALVVDAAICCGLIGNTVDDVVVVKFIFSTELVAARSICWLVDDAIKFVAESEVEVVVDGGGSGGCGVEIELLAFVIIMDVSVVGLGVGGDEQMEFIDFRFAVIDAAVVKSSVWAFGDVTAAIAEVDGDGWSWTETTDSFVEVNNDDSPVLTSNCLLILMLQFVALFVFDEDDFIFWLFDDVDDDDGTWWALDWWCDDEEEFDEVVVLDEIRRASKLMTWLCNWAPRPFDSSSLTAIWRLDVSFSFSRFKCCM
jgi:hypothetical protein